MPYKYKISDRTTNKIIQFYRNVAKKYSHTYSYEQMCKNIKDAFSSIYGVENGLLRRIPSLSRWKGLYMATSGKWNFAYKIEGDTIIVVDACHAQNMHEAIQQGKIIKLSESDVQNIVRHVLRRLWVG